MTALKKKEKSLKNLQVDQTLPEAISDKPIKNNSKFENRIRQLNLLISTAIGILIGFNFTLLFSYLLLKSRGYLAIGGEIFPGMGISYLAIKLGYKYLEGDLTND